MATNSINWDALLKSSKTAADNPEEARRVAEADESLAKGIVAGYLMCMLVDLRRLTTNENFPEGLRKAIEAELRAIYPKLAAACPLVLGPDALGAMMVGLMCCSKDLR